MGIFGYRARLQIKQWLELLASAVKLFWSGWVQTSPNGRKDIVAPLRLGRTAVAPTSTASSTLRPTERLKVFLEAYITGRI